MGQGSGRCRPPTLSHGPVTETVWCRVDFQPAICDMTVNKYIFVTTRWDMFRRNVVVLTDFELMSVTEYES